MHVPGGAYRRGWQDQLFQVDWLPTPGPLHSHCSVPCSKELSQQCALVEPGMQ